jgi:integrase
MKQYSEEVTMQGCRNLSDQEVSDILGSFSGKYAARDRALFCLGVHTGYRISELLSLRWQDVLTPKGEIGSYVTVARRNTKKKVAGRTVPLHTTAREALREWRTVTRHPAPQHPIFCSQKLDENCEPQAIDRYQADYVLRKAYMSCNVDGKVATHSMRKTFAVNVHEKLGRDISKTQQAMGHVNISNTVTYLSVDRSEIEKAILSL